MRRQSSPIFGRLKLGWWSPPLPIALGSGPVFAALIATGVATAQPTAQTPDPAVIALAPDDVPGWTQTRAARQASWNSATVPSAPADLYTFETEFTRDTPDGGQLLWTQAAETSPGGIAARFRALQQNALAQTPISLPVLGDQALGWWENVGNTRRGVAAARLGNLSVELHVTGVRQGDDVTDSQISAWVTQMVDRASAAPDVGPPDWSRLLPGTARTAPWLVLLDRASVGGDWTQATGLQLVSNELGGQALSVTASRDFELGAPYQRSLTSSATVYPSADDAVAQGMGGPGTEIAAPPLGDQATEFKMAESGGGREAPTVTYTVDVRRGAVVIAVQETGVVYSLDSPAETEGFATKAASLLTP